MFSAQWATALCTGLKAKQYRWLSPILPDDNCTKARWGDFVKLVETGCGPHLNIICDWIHEFMKSLSDRQFKSGPGAPGDPAAKSDQRVAKTFHHLDAQLDHRQHQSYCRSGRFWSNIVKVGANLLFRLCVLFSEKAVRTLQIQGRRGQVAEAWSSNLRVGRGGQFGQLGQLGQIGQLSQLRPSFIFTLAWSTLARSSLPFNTIDIILSCKHLQIRRKKNKILRSHLMGITSFTEVTYCVGSALD